MIHATVIGNLGRDGELRSVNGKAVLNFSVGTKGRGKDGATTWVRCAMWGARAEKVAQYMTKGTKVAAVGSLSTREHDGKTYVEIDVQELELLGGGQDRQPSRPAAEPEDPPF